MRTDSRASFRIAHHRQDGTAAAPFARQHEGGFVLHGLARQFEQDLRAKQCQPQARALRQAGDGADALVAGEGTGEVAERLAMRRREAEVDMAGARVVGESFGVGGQGLGEGQAGRRQIVHQEDVRCLVGPDGVDQRVA